MSSLPYTPRFLRCGSASPRLVMELCEITEWFMRLSHWSHVEPENRCGYRRKWGGRRDGKPPGASAVGKLPKSTVLARKFRRISGQSGFAPPSCRTITCETSLLRGLTPAGGPFWRDSELPASSPEDLRIHHHPCVYTAFLHLYQWFLKYSPTFINPKLD